MYFIRDTYNGTDRKKHESVHRSIHNSLVENVSAMYATVLFAAALISVQGMVLNFLSRLKYQSVLSVSPLVIF